MLIWRGFDPFRLYDEWRAYLGNAPARPRLHVVVNHRPRRDDTESDRAAADPTKSRSGTEPGRAQGEPPPRRRGEASLGAGAS